MSKILVTGDWQLDSRPPCDRREERGRSTRFDENVDTIRRMILAGAEAGCKAMVFGGDLTEERDPDSSTNTAAATLFRLAIDKGMMVYAMAGNHDGAIYDVSSSSIEPLGTMVGTAHFNTIHQVCAAIRTDSELIFLPYLHEATPVNIMTMLDKVTFSNCTVPRYLFAHYAVKDALIGKKNMVLPGDHLDTATMLPERFKGIYCFHVHKAQEVSLKSHQTGNVLGIAKFPGSPVICDHGESEDKKGYIILDEATGESSWKEIPQRRKWLTIPLAFIGTDAETKWTSDDIVKFKGEFNDGSPRPQDMIRKLIKSGQRPEPFHKSFEVKKVRLDRKLRGEGVSEAGGLRDAAAALFEKTWPGSGEGEAGKALELVLSLLSEAKAAGTDKKVVPVEIEIHDILTNKDVKYTFEAGKAVLIIGPNGKGKTNFFEAFLLAVCGQISKKLPNSMLVRQGAKVGWVSLILKGDSGYYRILRSITLGAKTTHKVSVVSRPSIPAGDGASWNPKEDSEKLSKSLADGGINETKEVLASLLGATFTSLKATNFSFQRDPSPIIGADVADRRAILAEILGLEPISKAAKKVNEFRLAAQKEVDELESKASALTDAINPERRKTLQDALEVEKGLLVQAETGIVSKKGNLEASKAALAEGQTLVSEGQTLLAGLPDSSQVVKAKEDALGALKTRHESDRGVLEAKYVTLRIERDEAVTKSQSSAQAPGLRQTAKTLRETAAKVRESKAEPMAMAAKHAAESQRLDGLARVETAKAVELRAEAAQEREKQAALQVKLGAINRTQTILDKTERGRLLTVLVGEIADLEAKVKDLEGKETGTCAECGQPVGRQHIEKHVKDAKEAIATKLAAKPCLEATLKEAEDRLAVMTKEFEDLGNFCLGHAGRAKGLDDQALVCDATGAKFTTESRVHEVDRVKHARSAEDLETSAAALENDATAKEVQAALLEAAEAEALAAGERAKVLTESMTKVEAEGAKLNLEYAAACEIITKELEVVRAEVVIQAEKKKKVEESLAKAQALVTTLTSTVEASQGLLQTAEYVKSGVESKMAGLKASLDEVDSLATKLADNRAIFAVKEKDLAIKKIACEGLRLLPGHLIDAKVGELEDGINRYMDFFGSDGLSVEIKTQDEEGNETLLILVDNGAEPRLDAAAFSGGELERIDKCLSWALADVAEEMRDTSLGMQALDEPGHFLDDNRKDKLLEMIHSRVSSGRTPVAIVISHDRKMISGFSTVYDFSDGAEGWETLDNEETAEQPALALGAVAS